jgi:DNA primase
MVSAECERQKSERADFRFSRRDVRQHTAWSDSQLKRHLHRLEELEYLLIHHGGRGQRFVYELAFERQGDSGGPVLSGLIEIEKLTGQAYDEKKSGLEGEKSAPSPAQVRGMSGGGAGEESSMLARRSGDPNLNLEKLTTQTGRGNRVVHAASRTRS